MKGCLQWNPVYSGEGLPRAGIELATTRSVGWRLTTELPELLNF